MNPRSCLAQASVVIPTHNRLARLRQALESVRGQTLPPAEIIVVDDGSTDGTGAMIGSEFPEVRYLHQPGLGVSAARNHGIRAASRPWIALLDSDDRWLPEKLARQFAALAREPGSRIIHSDEIWMRDGRRANPMRKHAKSGGMIYPRCLPRCVISPSAVMLHHTLFDEIGLFDEALPACEDYDLWLRICSRHPVTYIAQPLIVKYGGHEDQLSTRYRGMDRFRIRALSRMIDSGGLDGGNLRLTAQVLVDKAHIYLKGARKRSRFDEMAAYERLIERYRPLLEGGK